MAPNQKHDSAGKGRGDPAPRAAPEWADGLKQLYDSVVEEDLPDMFKDLLDQLDGSEAERGKGGAQPSPGNRNPGR